MGFSLPLLVGGSTTQACLHKARASKIRLLSKLNKSSCDGQMPAQEGSTLCWPSSILQQHG